MQYTSPEVYEFICKQTGDPIVEWKICEVSGAKFPITQKDSEFYEKISPVFNGKKYLIPTPRLCPEERQRRRLMFRNERKLYRRKCDATGEVMISMYPQDVGYVVYNTTSRWSDSWNPLDYGQEWDGNILETLCTLSQLVPKVTLINDDASENSNYVNQTTHLKDCYLVFDADYCEACMYSSAVKNASRIVDGLHVYFSEDCYNCMNCTNLYLSVGCVECNQSNYLIHCTRCTGCSFCYGCTNLVNKKYHIYNKPVSKEEYEQFIGGVNEYRKDTDDHPQRNCYHIKSIDCFGNNLYQSKECLITYNLGDCERVKYSSLLNDCRDCYDFDVWGDECEMIYECETVGESSSHLLFCRGCRGGNSRLIYCMDTMGSKDCFGCAGLRNAQYCIFNKQYTKEEYEMLVPKIVAHMQAKGERGEFFHPSLNPFGYNETVAQEYYPLTREEALKRGYKRQDNNYDPVVPAGVETLTGDQIPTDSKSVDGTILKKIFVCEVSGRPYRIIKQELAFYQKHNLPLPRNHPDVRHEERMKKRPGRTLYLRKCDKTGEGMVSVYPPAGRAGPPEYKGKVYSEEAYREEVYG